MASAKNVALYCSLCIDTPGVNRGVCANSIALSITSHSVLHWKTKSLHLTDRTGFQNRRPCGLMVISSKRANSLGLIIYADLLMLGNLKHFNHPRIMKHRLCLRFLLSLPRTQQQTVCWHLQDLTRNSVHRQQLTSQGTLFLCTKCLLSLMVYLLQSNSAC